MVGLNLLHRLHLSEVICFGLVLDLPCVPGVCTQVQKKNLGFLFGLEYLLVFLNCIGHLSVNNLFESVFVWVNKKTALFLLAFSVTLGLRVFTF